MPTVQVYQRTQPGPSALNAPKLSLNAPLGAFGGGDAAAIAGLGDAVSTSANRVQSAEAALRRRQEEIQKKRDSVKVSELSLEMQREIDDYRSNPETGYLNRKGADSFGVRQDVSAHMETLRAKYSEKLDPGNINQAELFRLDYKEMDNRAVKDGATYELKSLHEAEQKVAAAGFVASYETGLNAWVNPALDIDKTKAAKEEQLRLEGINSGTEEGKAIVDAELRKVESEMWKLTTIRMAQDNPDLAKERLKFLQDNNLMREQDELEVIAKVDAADLTAGAQEHTDVYMDGADDDKDYSRAAEANVMDQVRKDQEGKMEKEVSTLVRARFDQGRKMEVEIYDKRIDGAAIRIRDAATYEQARSVITKMTDVKDTDLRALEAYARDRFGVLKGGAVRVTDQPLMQSVREKIDASLQTDKPMTVAQIQLEMAGKATQADVEELVDYRNGGGNIKGLKNDTVKKWFKHYTKKTADERPTHYNEMWKYMIEQLVPGTLPTDDNVKQWATDYLTVVGQDDDFFFPDTVTRAESIQSNDGFRDYTDAELGQAKAIIQQYNEANPDKQKAVSEANIRAVITGLRNQVEGAQ